MKSQKVRTNGKSSQTSTYCLVPSFVRRIQKVKIISLEKLDATDVYDKLLKILKQIMNSFLLID